MITREEQISIIDQRVDILNYRFSLISDYIKKINDGMEDPGLTVNEYDLMLSDISYKIEALTRHKEML